ncbi:hypothetical protein GQ53DRAFT_652269 [Thozetella sp. PMI_491]|nr:hypothetical protein GQ53DRAFT_652269 [Thozetella sp. PMI_491]
MLANPTTQVTHPHGQVAVDYSANVPQVQQPYQDAQHAFSSQLDMTQPQGPARPGPYNMGAMASALPQPNYRPSQYIQGQQRYNQQYYLPQHPPAASYYPAPLSPSQGQSNMHQRPGIPYYPNTVVMSQQPHPTSHYYYAQPGQFAGQPQNLPVQMMPVQYLSSASAQGDPRALQSHQHDLAQAGSAPFPGAQGIGAIDSRQNVVRGPPRKPRQSGHAIWIGNLPPQTDLMNLVHHVCKEAAGLESLFLISKSNCAFANFKDEPSCVAAQQKLHDSRFQSVRLVSRLRKSTVEGATGMAAPTGPAATSAHQGQSKEPDVGEREEEGEATQEISQAEEPIPTEPQNAAEAVDASVQKDRFFVLKSLTVEDLELSVRTGIWATQSHNEETLNEAFKSADGVYLVFSANKSGEYFGYARMVSPINEDPAAAIEFAPAAQSATDPDLPKAIPTEATDHAPKGRIIDDSARGTIFWEADRDDAGSDGGGGQEEEAGSGAGSVAGDTISVKSGQEGPGSEPKAWGKPFKLEWISATRLPFYRTRGLRNPWNSNREVKIARDGTELEPSVGRRLIGLFHRDLSQAAALAPGGPGGVGLGGMPVVAGYPPMRSPYRQP